MKVPYSHNHIRGGSKSERLQVLWHDNFADTSYKGVNWFHMYLNSVTQILWNEQCAHAENIPNETALDSSWILVLLIWTLIWSYNCMLAFKTQLKHQIYISQSLKARFGQYSVSVIFAFFFQINICSFEYYAESKNPMFWRLSNQTTHTSTGFQHIYS